MALFWEAFSGKRFVCCALIVLYSTVGRSIASISDIGEHIYLGASRLGRIYRLYGPPYRTICITYLLPRGQYVPNLTTRAQSTRVLLIRYHPAGLLLSKEEHL